MERIEVIPGILLAELSPTSSLRHVRLQALTDIFDLLNNTRQVRSLKKYMSSQGIDIATHNIEEHEEYPHKSMLDGSEYSMDRERWGRIQRDRPTGAVTEYIRPDRVCPILRTLLQQYSPTDFAPLKKSDKILFRKLTEGTILPAYAVHRILYLLFECNFEEPWKTQRSVVYRQMLAILSPQTFVARHTPGTMTIALNSSVLHRQKLANVEEDTILRPERGEQHFHVDRGMSDRLQCTYKFLHVLYQRYSGLPLLRRWVG